MSTLYHGQPTLVDLHDHLAASPTDSAGIDRSRLDCSLDRRGAHPCRDRQQIEPDRVTLERRRSPEADTNVGSITTEFSGRTPHDELPPVRDVGPGERCGDNGCKPSVRPWQARRQRGHSTHSSLAVAVSGPRHDSPRRVPDAVNPPVSPPCLAETTLPPQSKAPSMSEPIASDSCLRPHHGRVAAAGEPWQHRRLVGPADEGG